MTDKTTRHVIAGLSLFSALLVYFAGYAAGAAGWWWAFPIVFVVYWIIFNLVEA